MIHADYSPADLFSGFADQALAVVPWVGAGIAAAIGLFFALLGVRKGLGWFFTIVGGGERRSLGGGRGAWTAEDEAEDRRAAANLAALGGFRGGNEGLDELPRNHNED